MGCECRWNGRSEYAQVEVTTVSSFMSGGMLEKEPGAMEFKGIIMFA